MAPPPSDLTADDPAGSSPGTQGYDPLQRFGQMGLTFDDVCLVPSASDVVPAQVSTHTHVTRDIELAVPLMSAAMDTVTEARLAIAIAREGGLGVVHRNLSIEDQVTEVDKVKRSESGMIVDPVTLGPDDLVGAALDLMSKFRISGVPIVEGDQRLVGILTNRDLRFENDPNRPILEVIRRRPSSAVTASRSCRSSTARAASPASSPSRTSTRRSSTPTPPRTPRVGCAARRPSAWVTTRWSVLRRWSPPASTCSSSTPRTVTPPGCSRW